MSSHHRTRSLAGGLLAALLLCGVAPIRAQTAAPARALAGQVVKGGAPVPGVPVTLHRVTASASGPVGSAVTDAGGGFRFQLPPPDTSSFNVFFVTAEHATVRYFGDPVHRDAPAAPYRVEVYDTASMIPGALRSVRRDMVLFPETDGAWEVNEVIRVRNSATRTLVATQGRPSWQFRLPEGATDFHAGEGDLPVGDVERRGDWVFLRSAIIPGEREIFVRYRLPANRSSAELVIASPTDSLNLFVRQPSPEIRITGMTTTRVLDVEQERFIQYGAADLAEQATIRMEWEGAGAPPVAPVAAGVAAAVLVLAAGTWIAIRNRRLEGPHASGPPARARGRA